MMDSPLPSRYLDLESLPRAQRERLAHIDFRLCFLGELRRSDIISRFEMGPAVATRDIAQYREMAPDNTVLDPATKVYGPTPRFAPLFEHNVQRVLTELSRGFGDGIDDRLTPLLRCEFPASLSLPKISVLAPITRAIHRGKAVRLSYTSVESGKTEREIVPFALVDIGARWQVRAYDRRRRMFLDFVLTRMEHPAVLEDSPIEEDERADRDFSWGRMLELEFVPHPNHERPEVVCMDYDLQDGKLRVNVRAAHVGYMLRRLGVDCSPDHHLPWREYDLWLPDALALYGANAYLAPGYQDPRGEKELRR
jgi:hypothetical protein